MKFLFSILLVCLAIPVLVQAQVKNDSIKREFGGPNQVENQLAEDKEVSPVVVPSEFPEIVVATGVLLLSQVP